MVGNPFLPQKMIYFLYFVHPDISGREHGSNKQVASKSCALSLVRQLYHLKVIEPFTGLKKKKDSEQIPEYEVGVAPDLEQKVYEYLRAQNIHAIPEVKICSYSHSAF